MCDRFSGMARLTVTLRSLSGYNLTILGAYSMSCKQIAQSIVVVIALFSLLSTANSEEREYEISLRANVLLGDGVPANDILGIGVIGRYFLRDGWFFAAALDVYDYDFEHPSNVVGISQDPNVKTIDAAVSNTVLSGFFGRR